MTPRGLARWLLGWALATAIACAFVHHRFALDVDEARPRAVVASVWADGVLVERAVLAHAGEREARLDAALAARPDATLVYESIVGEAPVLAWPEALLALSFVPGRDGVAATIGGRTEYLTPDELLARQAYDKGISVPSVSLSLGVDVPLALALLAEKHGTTVRDLLDRGTLRRIRVVRTVAGTPPARVVTAETMTAADVRDAALAAARYLARGVDLQGRFRYLVDAPTNKTLPGYDWPRHAGATYFLAQSAAVSADPNLAYAALRAAGYLRDHAMLRCGAHRCIGDDAVVDVGSTALAVLAFVEVARAKLDPGYALVIPELTAFLRGQQRADGEFMHLYDRGQGRPLDVQLLYYSGEATLALSRAHALLGDPRDLDAASRALAHLVGPAWSFFGSRYYWGEEHWTCQAMDDLWDRAPSPGALDFCLGWQAYGRHLMYGPGETPFDADGAYGFGPVVTPRLTPSGSRSEAGIATLEAARRAGRDADELAPLEQQLRRSLAMLLRHQLRPGPKHLFADPEAVDGAMPGSEVDWQLRIDYAQHTGSALLAWLRWLDLSAARDAARVPGEAGETHPETHPPKD
jgi:hypothetical protein